MISIGQLTVSFGGFNLFNDVSFMVNARDRIGLTGKNGAGKSTLLKIISGLQEPTSGTISKSPDITVGYLPQQIAITSSKTIIEEAYVAFSEILDLERKIEKLSFSLSERTDYESSAYLKLIEEHHDCIEQFELRGGHSIHGNVEKTLLGLGFTSHDFNRYVKEFSGGWRMRVELAKLLLKKPDVFLLDEPTNHLDIESIQWLEDYLKNYEGAVVLVSHDKAFLDNVTNRTVEISLGKIYDYKANYSKYVVLRKERREVQESSFRNQQKMIQDTEDFIDRFRYKASKAVQVQSRIKQLDKIDRIEIEEEDTSSIHMRFPTPVKSGRIVLDILNVGKKYGEKIVLNGIDLKVESGDRIAFVGKNGEGKSTLSKIIVKEIDSTGTVTPGHNVKLGYFAQNQDELMDENCTVFDTIDRVAVGEIRNKIRDILGAFLFRGDDVLKKVKVLSGGERSRLAIAKLLLEPYNLLVLDEPTNHLDMRSKEILKQSLINYEGTLIIVSHDREFLDGLVNKIYEFKEGKTKEFLGGIYEFLEKKKLSHLNELNIIEDKKVIPIQETKAKVVIAETKIVDKKNNYADKKEWDKIIRKAQNKVKESEEKIQQLEEKIAHLSKIMAEPELLEKYEGKDSIFDTYSKFEKQLHVEMSHWELYQMEVDDLINKNK